MVAANEKLCRHASLHKKGIKQTIRFLYEQCTSADKPAFFVFISAPRDRHKAVTTNDDNGNKTNKQNVESSEKSKQQQKQQQ